MALDHESLLLGLGLGVLLACVVGWITAILVVRPQARHHGSAWWAPIAQVRRLRALLAQHELDSTHREGRQTAMLDEFRSAYEQRAQEIQKLQDDVRDAVKKTRELREELIERATEEARAAALNTASSVGHDSPNNSGTH